MGLFGKRKARKAAEEKAEATQSGKWDNPTQTKKPAYKQKGFDAGEGTNRNGSGPNKNGDDNYTPPARKSSAPEKRKPNKAVSLEVKKPKDADAPTLGPRTDTKPEPQVKQKKLKRKERKSLEKDVRSAQASEFRANREKERNAATEARKNKQKQVTADKAKATKDKDTEKAKNTYKQGEQLGTPKSTTPKKKVVTSDDKKGQEAIATGNARATANRKAKGSVKSGESYTYIDSKGRKTTATKP